MQQIATATPRRSRLPFSLLSWLKGYDRSWLRFDVIAALTTWALVVPLPGDVQGLPTAPESAEFLDRAGGGEAGGEPNWRLGRFHDRSNI